MTREEAINSLKAQRDCNECCCNGMCDGDCDECDLMYGKGTMGEMRDAYDVAIKALQEQKVGKWESVYMDTVCGKFEAENKVCSVCGHSEKYIVAPYCRWCGAKMEGEEKCGL